MEEGILGESYWDGNGEYQEWVNDTISLMPRFGTDTDSLLLNAFIEVNNLYYDYYNNGGFNLYEENLVKLNDLINQVSKQTDKNISTLDGEYFTYDNEEDVYFFDDKKLSKKKLENFMNSLFGALQGEDMSCTLHYYYFNHQRKKVSVEPIEGYQFRTFDSKKFRDEHMSKTVELYRLISGK